MAGWVAGWLENLILMKTQSSAQTWTWNLDFDLGFVNLEDRRIILCLNFALKAEKHPKFTKWFQSPVNTYNTRDKRKYLEIYANHARYSNSPLGYLTKLLNIHYSTK